MDDTAAVPRSRRRTLLVAGLAGAVVVAVAVAVAIGTASGTPLGDRSDAPPASTSATARASGSPTQSDGAVAAGRVTPSSGADDEARPADAPVQVPPLGDIPPQIVQAGETATVGDGVVVSVVDVRRVDVSGSGLGEYAGAGIAVTVRVVNDGSSRRELSTPAVPVLSDPATKALPSAVDAGSQVEATYRFAEPSGGETALAVVVLLAPETEPVVVQGLATP